MTINTLIAFGLGLIFLYILGSVFVVPVRFIGKLIINGLIGGILLWIINLLGGSFGIEIAINPISAIIVGFLGIPGVLLLVLLQFIF